ncbi:MAG: hemerythrin domain-containing protein [Proteobacteria bacterium]|nr:hemerythrin domain-containing protein [Pseudomonadota bacterium]
MALQGHSVPRRSVLGLSLGGAIATTLILPGCAKSDVADEGVSATEDLMREHGVLRRLLVICRESAAMLLANAPSFDAGALAATADLFKSFGEDYHERQLEEAHIFPAVRRTHGEAANLIDTLMAQHAQGREVTTYIKDTCASGRVPAAQVERLSQTLVGFARMYEVHAAYEDTIVFQAWKATMSASQLREVGDQFEDIEHTQFHGDGFDMAVDQVLQIEQRLGLHDLGRYSASAPAPE